MTGSSHRRKSSKLFQPRVLQGTKGVGRRKHAAAAAVVVMVDVHGWAHARGVARLA